MGDINAADLEQLQSMVDDWFADNDDTDLTDGLIVDWDDIYVDDGVIFVCAHDEDTAYTLSDDGTGNIRLSYSGAR